MTETDYLEKQMLELEEKEWELFWKGYAKEYPIARGFVNSFAKRIRESWEKINMYQNKEIEGEFFIDKDGELNGSSGFWLFLGILGQEVLNLIGESTVDKKEFEKLQKKIVREVKKTATKTAEGIAIRSIRIQADLSPIECKECGHSNTPDAIYCNQCRKKLSK